MNGIPRTLFHGTRTVHAESILKSGIKVATEGNHEGFDTRGLVYFTDSEKAARFFGSAANVANHDPSVDFTLLIIDAHKAMTKGCVIVEAPGLETYDAKQYVSMTNIPASCIAATKRVWVTPDGVKEDYREVRA